MGYKIWRKDKKSWCLAFDDVFVTKELVDTRIQELNAVHHELVRRGELSFYPYREDIKLSRDGEILDNTLVLNRPRRLPRTQVRSKRK